MTDRENSPACCDAAHGGARASVRGDRGGHRPNEEAASVSYVDFRLDHHIARKSVSPSREAAPPAAA